jgi:hypothetical protein
MYIIGKQLFNYLERSISLKKLNIFLLSLTILSFCFYLVFFNFIEKVEYSFTTDELLYKNPDFIGMDINAERKDEETGEYLYKIVSSRSESKIFKKYEHIFEIKESPPMIEFCGHEKPSIFIVIEIIVADMSFGCTSESYGDNVIILPYTSKYILFLSLILLATLGFVNLDKLIKSKIVSNKFPFLMKNSNKKNQFILILILLLFIISFYLFNIVNDFKYDYLETGKSERILEEQNSGW